jgi:hypothetical protein
MYELVIMVCLLANENDCREYRVRGTEAETVFACMNEAKAKGEAWLKKNDTYRLIGVRCAKDSNTPFAPGDKS